MTVKKRLNYEERYNLTDEQIYLAEKYLRQHQTKGALSKHEATPMYELRLLGYSYTDIAIKYSKIPMGQILLTAALNGWEKDAENISASVFDRIKATMIRSTVEQVEMLTKLISVYNTETNQQIQSYLLDPKNVPPPDNRIQNFKELQRTIEMLGEVTNAVKNLTSPPKEIKESKNKVATKSIAQKGQYEEATILADLAGDKEFIGEKDD